MAAQLAPSDGSPENPGSQSSPMAAAVAAAPPPAATPAAPSDEETFVAASVATQHAAALSTPAEQGLHGGASASARGSRAGGSTSTEHSRCRLCIVPHPRPYV